MLSRTRNNLNVIKDDKDIHGNERDLENVLKDLESDLNAENWALIKRYFKVLNASGVGPIRRRRNDY